jgi:CubicO group peptidase (beta-lactamase class C family)
MNSFHTIQMDWFVDLLMKTNRFLSLVALAATVAAIQSRAAVSLEKVDTLVADQMKAKNLIGISVAIVEDGKVTLAKGYGKRSLADNAPVQSDTPFAIGSVTKQFTCGAILILADDGRLSVNDPVSKYYPNLTKAGQITILDLMNHVSGYSVESSKK